NSLQWLNAENNLGISDTLEQTQTKLAVGMGNNNNGNWDDTEVQGKLKYIADNNLDLEVHYVGGEKLPGLGAGDYVDPNGNGTVRNDGAITWEWIMAEMKKGQDIELMTSTHWVVLEGVLSFGNIRMFSYRDDNYQHGAATTVAERAKLDDRHTWSYFTDGQVNIGNGNEVLLSAVAESPVPVPAGVWLFGSGLIAFVRLAHRRSY
ncbi:MAG: hypothetical protein GXP22_04005, partial [Gammaproteobacteria bacterium]|nr:hypothetical protein [Gammaproteobacteria bacterium]